jgi:hypothetical protein
MKRTRILLGPSLALVAAALASYVSGCNATVTNGIPDDGEADGALKAVAQAPSEADPNLGSAYDDGSIVISLASDALTCSSSTPNWIDITECPDSSHWFVRFRLPPAMQTPGVYDIAQLDSVSQEVNPLPPNGCEAGGGTMLQGTVEVVSIDDENVIVTLAGTSMMNGGNVDGTYEVPFCSPPTPSNPQPGAVNAVAHEDDGTYYYEDESTSVVATVGTGGGVEPALALTIGNLVNACSANLPACDAPGWAVSIKLPSAFQAVGTYSLDNPELSAGFSVTFPPSGPDDCSGGGGSFWDGTISVLSIDAASVTFELSGTAAVFDYGNVDGVYTAPRCN